MARKGDHLKSSDPMIGGNIMSQEKEMQRMEEHYNRDFEKLTPNQQAYINGMVEGMVKAAAAAAAGDAEEEEDHDKVS